MNDLRRVAIVWGLCAMFLSASRIAHGSPQGCVNCPPTAIFEAEACGASTNDGCNVSPARFEPINCGDTICGTFWWDGTLRDTDWYEVTLTSTTCVTWTVFANVEVDAFIFDAACPPTVLASATGVCPTVASATIGPGVFHLAVAPKFAQPVIACGGPQQRSEYLATVTCTPCDPPCCPSPTASLTIRSGEVAGSPGAPGQADSNVRCTTTSIPGACEPVTLFPTSGVVPLMTTACNGPFAVVVAPHSSWGNALDCDPDARWINHAAGPALLGFPAKSVLYCHPFIVSDAFSFDTACLTFCWMVDDSLGDPANGPVPIGVFLRNGAGQVTPVPALSGGNNSTDSGPITVTLPPGALTAGGNQLLIYQRELGCSVSGVIYSARFDFCTSGVTPPVDKGCCNPFGPGFTDPECAALVCAIEPSCCDAPCDEWCRYLASLHCDCCQTCLTPPQDMVAWWTLDEAAASPTVADSAGGHTGVVLNGPTTVAGMVGNALRFNGTNQQISAQHGGDFDFGEGAFSMDAWINWDGGQSGTIACSLTTGGFPWNAVSLEVSSLGELGVGLQDLCIRTCAFSSAGAVTAGTWNHVALTASPCTCVPVPASCNDCEPPVSLTCHFYCECCGSLPGRVFTLYVNGTPVHSFTDPSGAFCHVTSASPWTIGGKGNYGCSGFFPGAIDEVQIFDRELPQSEIQAIYSAGSNGKCKHRCHVPWTRAFSAFGPVTNQILIPITICNDSPAAASFQVDVSAGAASSTCTGPALSGFTIVGSNPATIPGNTCQIVWLNVPRPQGLTANLFSCYEVCVTNVATGARCHCHGRVTRLDDGIDPGTLTNPGCCIAVVDRGGTIGPPLPGEPVEVLFAMSNDSKEPIATPLHISMIHADLNSGPIPITLDDLPPGVPKEGFLELGPGESTEIPVVVTFVEHVPFQMFDLVLATDFDGNDEMDDVWSFGFASRVEQSRAGKPCPGDVAISGIVDGADLTLILGNWGEKGGAGDANNDGVIDGGDIAVVLGSWGPCW